MQYMIGLGFPIPTQVLWIFMLEPLNLNEWRVLNLET
jgi:hypothetical protein